MWIGTFCISLISCHMVRLLSTSIAHLCKTAWRDEYVKMWLLQATCSVCISIWSAHATQSLCPHLILLTAKSLALIWVLLVYCHGTSHQHHKSRPRHTELCPSTSLSDGVSDDHHNVRFTIDTSQPSRDSLEPITMYASSQPLQQLYHTPNVQQLPTEQTRLDA